MYKQTIIYFSLFFLLGVVKANGDACVVTEYEKVAEAVENCKDIVLSNLEVPGGQQLVLHLNEGTTLIFRGKTTFGYSEWTGPLVSLKGSNITVKGEEGSILDGQGSLYWDGQGTHLNNNKPRFFRVTVEDAVLEGMHIRNCPVLCILIRSSNNLVVRNWLVDNLEAHNTDGFNIEDSNNILVEHSTIYNQDDCVVFAGGKNVAAHNLFCHGSHGLSIKGIGSVLDGVLFADSILTMGQNGIHIKTVTEGDPGIINNVTYSNITILDSSNYGINIQQNYPNNGAPDNRIPIYNLQLKNIYGNVLSGAIPVSIVCAEDGCFDWEWQDVHILGTNRNNCTNYIPDGYNDCL